MVCFTCGNCGESLKKPSVAKHYMGRCRGPINVTCVDCMKDFRGDEYVEHIKCLTEEERYSAKGFTPKPSSNKGERKQMVWFDAVRNIVNSDESLKADEKELLTILSVHENIPRKRGKFINFLTNAHKGYARREGLVERVWNIIEKAANAATATQNVSNGTTEKDTNEEKSMNGDGEDNASKENKTLKNGKTTEDEVKTSNKKSKRKGGVIVEEESNKKIKVEIPQNIVTQTLENEGGNVSLYKLLQVLEKHCAAEAGVEKAAKKFKKIQKKIMMSLEGSSITVDVTQLNK